jgi:DNA polymerase-3 subunit gamma/tau
MGLYQLIRPTEWNEVVGNNKIIGSLRGLVKRKPEKRPHSIMFMGPKGCGKTTLARILAKEFGANPDNIFEYNAANTRGIETIREVVSGINLSAMGGGAKCYIFDESHQLTPAAQQALLKDTEETPNHCYFFFCTTDPQNLIPALRERFTDYEVYPLSTKNIISILKRACKIEKLDVSEDILEIIACNCDGSPRASLVLLEMVMDVKEEDAIELLVKKIDSNSSVFDLCRMLLRKPTIRKKEWKKILAVFNSIDEVDSERIRHGMVGFLLSQYKNIPETDIEYATDVTRLIELFSTNTYYGKKKQLTALVMKACLLME